MSVVIKDSNGQLVPTVVKLGTSQAFTVTNSSVASTAFGPFTTMVRVACSAGHAHFQFGTTPVASITTSPMIPQNWSEMFAVNPGDKIAVIKDATVTASTVTVTEII